MRENWSRVGEVDAYFRKHGIPAPKMNDLIWLPKILDLLEHMDKQIDDLQYKLAAAKAKEKE